MPGHLHGNLLRDSGPVKVPHCCPPEVVHQSSGNPGRGPGIVPFLFEVYNRLAVSLGRLAVFKGPVMKEHIRANYTLLFKLLHFFPLFLQDLPNSITWSSGLFFPTAIVAPNFLTANANIFLDK